MRMPNYLVPDAPAHVHPVSQGQTHVPAAATPQTETAAQLT